VKHFIPIMALLLVFAPCAAAGTPVLQHRAEIRIDPDTSFLRVTDHLSVPAGVDSLRINAVFAMGAGEVGEPGPSSPELAALPVSGSEMLLEYHGALLESTEGVVFSRENVGREISATIGDEGVYLSASSGWLPLADEVMCGYELTVDLPAGWECVTQGRRVSSVESEGRVVTVWRAEYPSDGLTLIANRYHISREQFGDVEAQVYLLDDDPRLAGVYLERTGAYLEMYSGMIGPYPYSKFATVENWFPTGYGMPSWTLLGGQVMRLPFIPYTSFGHEICHNWWGNSVFVDEQGGNWCEGVTVYCADYHYKELESPAAAREYRRNLLKDYDAYVHGGLDMPLSGFSGRHSGATRAVGYGKSMMVYHMVERMIGRDAFLAALRDVYASHRFTDASWSDFFAAFTRAGGRDLDDFRDQWLEREGAPRLELRDVNRDGDRVTVTLAQAEPVWNVEVPIVFEGPGGEVERIVTLAAAEAEFHFDAPRAVAVAVDPDYHLFRRLPSQEIEPTLSQVLGALQAVFELPPPSAPTAAAAQEFAKAWAENAEPVIVDAGTPTPEGAARILVNPDPATVAEMLPAELQLAGGLAFLGGRRIDLERNDLVFAAQRPGTGSVDLVVMGSDPSRLSRLGSRLGHYGKYSYLVFPGGHGNVEKGNWRPEGSPLRREIASRR